MRVSLSSSPSMEYRLWPRQGRTWAEPDSITARASRRRAGSQWPERPGIVSVRSVLALRLVVWRSGNPNRPNPSPPLFPSVRLGPARRADSGSGSAAAAAAVRSRRRCEQCELLAASISQPKSPRPCAAPRAPRPAQVPDDPPPSPSPRDRAVAVAVRRPHPGVAKCCVCECTECAAPPGRRVQRPWGPWRRRTSRRCGGK